MAQHISHINARKKLTNLSTLMKELGTENFYIELIEYCRCSTSEELRKREGELIRAHKPD
jgi:hypothetical protein